MMIQRVGSVKMPVINGVTVNAKRIVVMENVPQAKLVFPVLV